MNENNPSPRPPLFSLSNEQLAYCAVRLGLGTNLFFHGLVRLPKLSGFVAHMKETFAESLLPAFLVVPMGYLIPIAELLIGAMLLLGLKTKAALLATIGLMLLLMTGCCFAENWGPINSQIVLLVLAAALIAKLPLNRMALTPETPAHSV